MVRLWIALVLILISGQALAVGFADEFSRADGTIIGNGWVNGTSWGNSGGSGTNTIPYVQLSGGTVMFVRNGRGTNAGAYTTHAIPSSSSVRCDLYAPSQNANVLDYLCANSDSLNGVSCSIRRGGYADPTHVQIHIEKQVEGVWSNLGSGYYDLGNIGWATYQITTDCVGGVTVSVTANGSPIFSMSFSLVQSLFTGCTLKAVWNDFGSNVNVYADKVSCETAPSSVADIRSAAEGTPVSLSDVIVTSCFTDNNLTPTSFAVEYPNRCAGILVTSSQPVNPGDIVTVNGYAETVDSERVIHAGSIQVISSGNAVPAPLGMSNRSLGGGYLGVGLNNVGSRIRTWGRVTAKNETNDFDGYFYLDDGSALNDGSGNTGIRCRPPASISGSALALPAVGDMVIVNGIVGATTVNSVGVRYLRTTELAPAFSTTVTGSDGVSHPELLDGSTTTGMTISSRSFTINRNTASDVITIGLHITASSSGTVDIRCGDIMAIPVAYSTGSRWYKTRIPYSASRSIIIYWYKPGAIWNEVQVSGRTQLPAPTSVIASSRTVALSSTSTPTSDFTGFNTNFWDHGLVDGMTISGTREEMIQRLSEFGATSLRYPGGAAAYGYPPSTAAIPAYRTAYYSSTNYGLNTCYGLVDASSAYATPAQFFTFCHDAGITAFYQINPGYWYDSAGNVVRKTIAMDALSDTYTGNYVAQNVAYIQSLVGLANSIGVNVVWELSNEDVCYYTATTFAALCDAYVNGIRAVNPSAKIALYGDSSSWSDPVWHNDFLSALVGNGVVHADYSSQHLYTDSGSSSWTVQTLAERTASFWSTIGPYEAGLTNSFNNAGLGPTKTAITEYNATGPMWGGTTEVEYSVGRSLGEAIAVGRMQQYQSSIWFHDLVRNDYSQLFFNRLDYYPGNAVGKRYHWFAHAAAEMLVVPQGAGLIQYQDWTNGIFVSRHSDHAYISVVNGGSAWKNITFTLNGVTLDRGKSMDGRSFRAAAAECYFFDYYTKTWQTAPPASGQQVTIQSPPYSVVGVKVYTL